MDKNYLVNLFRCMKEIMAENRDYLIELDSVVGDGDLGLTMSDGFAAACEAAEKFEGSDAGKLLYAGGKAMLSAVPSTMGTLMASGFLSAGKALVGKSELTAADIARIFEAYMEGVAHRGKAKPGDKTFLDGLSPAVEALNRMAAQGRTMKECAEAAVSAAEEGFKNTATMVAVHGRAATRGEASRSLLDPGAAVAMLLMKALAKSAA